jgi:hypothetical protein
MNRYSSAILCILLLLFAVPTVNAAITSHSCADDSDGAIIMTSPSWTDNGNKDYTLSMNCAQWGFPDDSAAPGHLAGDFQTDTELDPTVRILEDITNDTTFAWTDYHITIGMTQSFSFLGLTAPAGWAASIVGPAAGYIPNGGPMGYVATINYVMGTGGSPIDIGGDDIFGFKVSFLGSTNFSTEQIPTPEPTTILLLGLGAMSVIRRRR